VDPHSSPQVHYLLPLLLQVNLEKKKISLSRKLHESDIKKVLIFLLICQFLVEKQVELSSKKSSRMLTTPVRKEWLGVEDYLHLRLSLGLRLPEDPIEGRPGKLPM
jgi:hypothetical protein